jgi:hypothetical protein
MLLHRYARIVPALGALAVLASCAGSGTSSSSLPGSTAAQSAARRTTEAVRSSTPTDLLYVVVPGELDAYDVSTDTPPTQPYFSIKSKKFGSAPSVAMAGTALFAASGRSTNQSSPIWAPAPTSAKSKITYSCAKDFNTEDAAGATASASAIYTTVDGREINVLDYPFSGPKCPKKPTHTWPVSNNAEVLFATQNNNLYYTDDEGNVWEVPNGSSTPQLLGTTGGISVANMTVDSYGHIIAVDYNTCNLYIFTPGSGSLSLTTMYPVSTCSREFDQGGIIIDGNESRIFIGDYASNTIDVVNYSVQSGTPSAGYNFATKHNAWSIAVSPVDSL